MKYITLKPVCFIAAILLAAAQPTAAQDAPPPAPDFSTERLGGDDARKPRSPTLQRALIPAGLLYASFDTDGDFAASRAELIIGINRSFAAADKNANGTLSLVELAAWREAILGSRDLMPGNTQFDKNFDSQINPSEFQSVLTDIFDRYDRNENDQLEFGEMTKNLRQIRPSKSRERERSVLSRQQGQRRPRGY